MARISSNTFSQPDRAQCAVETRKLPALRFLLLAQSSPSALRLSLWPSVKSPRPERVFFCEIDHFVMAITSVGVKVWQTAQVLWMTLRTQSAPLWQLSSSLGSLNGSLETMRAGRL